MEVTTWSFVALVASSAGEATTHRDWFVITLHVAFVVTAAIFPPLIMVSVTVSSEQRNHPLGDTVDDEPKEETYYHLTYHLIHSGRLIQDICSEKFIREIII